MQTFARKLSVIVSLVILATSGGTVSGCAKLKSKLKKETQFKQTSGIPAAPISETSPICAEGECATIPYTRRITSAALFDLYRNVGQCSNHTGGRFSV